MLKLNVSNFNTLIKKATLFYTLNNVYFSFDGDKIESKMLSPSKDFAIILNIHNDVLNGVKGETVFNFFEPQENLLPFLKILESNEVDIRANNNKMVILNDKQKMDIFFCDDSVIDKFNVTLPEIDSFFDMSLSNDILNDIGKIKKFSKFEKLYLTIIDGKLFIEVGDKVNRFSNMLSIELGNVDYSNYVLCFKSINIMKFLGIMDTNKDWYMKLYKINDDNGMLEFNSGDEKYYFMSRLDI